MLDRLELTLMITELASTFYVNSTLPSQVFQGKCWNINVSVDKLDFVSSRDSNSRCVTLKCAHYSGWERASILNFPEEHAMFS